MTVIHDNVPGGWWRVWTEAEGTLAYCSTLTIAMRVAEALKHIVDPVQLSKTGEEETP